MATLNIKIDAYHKQHANQLFEIYGKILSIMKNKTLAFIASSLAALTISGCGGGGPSGGSASVVVNETKTIADGAGISYSLAAGSYSSNITSTPNGVTISWVGGSSCTNATVETTVYNSPCTMGQAGQLVITNPTTFGLGPSENVYIKLTKN